jgi:hypothetical protein
MAQVKALPDGPLLSVGTVRDRYYGHAEGTAGEGSAGSGLAAMVTAEPQGEARPRRPLASLARAAGPRQLGEGLESALCESAVYSPAPGPPQAG